MREHAFAAVGIAPGPETESEVKLSPAHVHYCLAHDVLEVLHDETERRVVAVLQHALALTERDLVERVAPAVRLDAAARAVEVEQRKAVCRLGSHLVRAATHLARASARGGTGRGAGGGRAEATWCARKGQHSSARCSGARECSGKRALGGRPTSGGHSRARSSSSPPDMQPCQKSPQNPLIFTVAAELVCCSKAVVCRMAASLDASSLPQQTEIPIIRCFRFPVVGLDCC